MVERPIKKSERQASSVSDQAENKSSPPPTIKEPPIKGKERKEHKEDRPPRKGKSEGRGKGSREEPPAKPANLALMRGPKPVKPKPPVEEEPVVEVPETSEAEATDVESTTSEAEATEAAPDTTEA